MKSSYRNSPDKNRNTEAIVSLRREILRIQKENLELRKGYIEVMVRIISKLPDSEKYDLKDQLSRSVKAIPRLIAEGYAKTHQKQGFQRYIDDAMGECNETIVGIEMCRDIYGEYIGKNLCQELVNMYDICGRQLYRLREA